MTLTLSTNMSAPMDDKNESEGTNNDGTSKLLSITKRKDFLFGVCGASAFISFCFSIYNVRRTSIKYSKEVSRKTPEIPEVFAMKTLAVGTIVAVSSFSLFWWCAYKLLGANNIYEFHAKLRTYFPDHERKGRTEFANLRELADFLISEDRKAEMAKNKQIEDTTPKES